ncbi:MAG: tetratricopeptide repeat protein, partial [Chloroflexi bacterium]|nr:tetratricopeptide repeat protein [Chloroflexota bacterium]
MFQRLILGAIIFLAACVPIPQAASVELTPTPDVIATPAFSSDPFNDGLIARRNGDYARARAAFQRALDSNPAPDLATDARFRLAEADWLNRDYARAVPAFSAFLQQNPNSPRVNSIHYFLADAYLRLKDYPNALAEYQIFRAQTPTLVGDTDGAIADVLVLAGDSDAALKQYERALQDATLAPLTKFNILIRYADVHQGRGESALAAQKYDAALAFAPDAKNKADILLKAGEAYAAANQLENAFARWNSAINQTPEQPSAYKALVDLVNRGATVDDFQRGLVDYHAAQYDAAIAAFERELKSDQARAGDAHYYLGSSYARKSAPAQAIAEFDFIIKNLSKDKRVADAYLGKIAAYAAQGRTDDAVTVAKKFAAAVAEDARADDALVRAGQILDRAQRYRDAAELYELAQT